MRSRPIAWITGGLLIVCFGCAASKTQQKVRTKDVWRCYPPVEYMAWKHLKSSKYSKPESRCCPDPMAEQARRTGVGVWQYMDGRLWDRGNKPALGLRRDGRYAVILQPDGVGRYYDFAFAGDNGKAEQRDAFQCERR